MNGKSTFAVLFLSSISFILGCESAVEAPTFEMEGTSTDATFEETDPIGKAGSQTGAPDSNAPGLLREPPDSVQAHPTAPSGPDSPDVFLVVIDTLRRDAIIPYGSSRETTPFLDRLAGEGVVFENAYSTSSWTVPAMYSMITGLYPREHGVDKGGVGKGGVVGQPVLPDEAVTLTERLKERGYSTYGVCTNHHLHTRFGFAQGFDTFVGSGFLKLPFPEMAVDSFGDDKKEDVPSFYWLHYFDPHFPYRDNQPWFTRWNESGFSDWEALTFDASRRIYSKKHGLVEGDKIPFEDITGVHRRARMLALSHPRELLEVAGWSGDELLGRYRSFMRAAYDSEIARVDASVEKVLDDLGVGPEDLVIIVADHGEEFGDHGSIGHRWLSSLHQELVRVPLIVLLPGRVRAGQRVAAPVSLVDIVPTVLDVLGLDTAGDEHSGVSLLAAMDEPRDMGRSLHGELEEPSASVRFRLEYPYKYIHNFSRGRGELYNLERDPEERVDLFAKQPGRAAEMEKRLREWMGDTRLRFGEVVTVPLSTQELERLRAMGYVM